MPITPTRSPVKSTPSCGQCAVWYELPAEESVPGISGILHADRQPVAITKYRARDGVAAVGLDPPGPTARRSGPRYPGAEADVAAQAEPVGDVAGVPEDLGLRRVALGPAVVLLKLGGERERVVDALHVDAGAGVAVPVPGAADVVAGLEHDDAQARARSRWSMYRPAKPAPTITASTVSVPSSATSALVAGAGRFSAGIAVASDIVVPPAAPPCRASTRSRPLM